MPLILAYVSALSSVYDTVATSQRRIGSRPSIPISNKIRSSSSSLSLILSPTLTSTSALPSVIYPAGMEKFCALKIAETFCMVITPVMSALARAASLELCS